MKVGDLVEYCHSTKPELGVVVFAGSLAQFEQTMVVFPGGNTVTDFRANFRVVRKRQINENR